MMMRNRNFAAARYDDVRSRFVQMVAATYASPPVQAVPRAPAALVTAAVDHAALAAQQARDAMLARIDALSRDAAAAGFSREFTARVLADSGTPDVARRRLGLVLAGSDVPAPAPAGNNHGWDSIMAEAAAWRRTPEAAKETVTQREPSAADNYGWADVFARHGGR